MGHEYSAVLTRPLTDFEKSELLESLANSPEFVVINGPTGNVVKLARRDHPVDPNWPDDLVLNIHEDCIYVLCHKQRDTAFLNTVVGLMKAYNTIQFEEL